MNQNFTLKKKIIGLLENNRRKIFTLGLDENLCECVIYRKVLFNVQLKRKCSFMKL